VLGFATFFSIWIKLSGIVFLLRSLLIDFTVTEKKYLINKKSSTKLMKNNVIEDLTILRKIH